MARVQSCIPLAVVLAIAACSDERPRPPADSQRAVLSEPAQVEAASFAQMVGELGIQIEADVPPADAEALQRLMSNSGFHIKSIRRVAPGRYRLDVWGVIPHAASEFTLERQDTGWKIVGDTPWVLIG